MWGTGGSVWARGARAVAYLLLAGVLLTGQVALAVDEPGQPEARADATTDEAPPADRKVLDRARGLLEQRQGQQAYELLAPHEYDWAGDPEYDRLLGNAALASGRPDEAAMALERAAAAEPGDPATRTALARAYHYSGESALARSELDDLGIQRLPRDAYRDDPLRDIDTRGRRRERSFRYYVMFDAGYDSNANAATDDDTFLGLALDNRNVEQDTVYAAVSNGGVLNVPLSAKWDYDLKFNFSQRRNFSATFANTDRAGLNNEFAWRSDYTMIKFGAGVHTTHLDSRAPYDGTHAQSGAHLGFWGRWLMGDSSWQVGMDAVAAALRHDRRIRVLDIDQFLTAFTLDYLSDGPQPSFGLALVVGDAHAVQSGSPYGRDEYGAHFTSSWPVGVRGKMYGHLGVTKSDYDGRFFGTLRDDTQYSTGISAVLHVFPSRNWSLIPHFAYIHNQSNVALFDYDRAEIGLAFRWVSD